MNYYALLVALVILTAFLMHGNQPGNKKYVIVACLLLFAIYGLRDTYRIGVDTTSTYISNFSKMHNAMWSEVVELHRDKNLCFYLMTKAFSEYISTDYQLYITSISLFVTICFGRLIYKYSPSPVQSILYHFGLLLYVFHFSALKQSIAMAILMLAFDYLVDRKPIQFVLTVLVASLFHLPSIIFLPSYWLTRFHLGKKYLIVFGVALIMTYLFRNQILNIMNSVYNEDAEEVNLSGVRFLRTKALIMVLIAVTAVLLRTPTSEDRIYGCLLQFMGFATLLQTFCGYDNTFERLADYYFQFAVIFIPMVFDKNTERKALFDWRLMELVDTFGPVVFCGYGVYRFLTYVSDYRFYSPFHFFFEA